MTVIKIVPKMVLSIDYDSILAHGRNISISTHSTTYVNLKLNHELCGVIDKKARRKKVLGCFVGGYDYSTRYHLIKKDKKI